MQQNNACENTPGRCACAWRVQTRLSLPRAWPCRARERHNTIMTPVAVVHADGTLGHARGSDK
eukprot:6596196-Lingulodinium_polyedra.AAC.1